MRRGGTGGGCLPFGIEVVEIVELLEFVEVIERSGRGRVLLFGGWETWSVG